MKQTNYTKNWIDKGMLEKYEKYRQVIKSDISQLVSIICSTPKEFLRILDIGGGDGKPFIQIARALIKNGKDFSIDYIDISKQQLYWFLKNMRREGLTEKIRYIELIPWQKETSLATEKYDVVLAIRSWYEIDNWKEDNTHNTLRKVKGCLKEDGTAYLIVQKKGTLSERIGLLLEKIVTGTIQQRITTGENISDVLKKLKIKHEIKDSYCNKFTIFDLLKGERLTRVGKDIISYMLMAYSNTSFNNLSKEQKVRIVEVIKEQQSNPDYAANNLITIFH